jgi:hypothetical protein
MRRLSVLMVSALALTGTTVLLQPAASAAVAATGTYHAVPPTRILDTRASGGGGPLAAKQIRTVTVRGPAVPATASAVVLTVTVTAPSAGGHLTVYPADQPTLPASSTLNFGAGRTVPNLVVVRVPGAGAGSGAVRIYNGSNGHSDALVDVSGYFTGSDAPAGLGAFGALATPRRVLDTRDGTGGVPRAAVAGKHAVSFGVTGSGVPADASAVVLNVSATAPVATGFVTAYPAGAARPNASNLNFVRGLTIANLVVVPVGAGGKVTLYNGSAGSAQLFADVSGYFRAGDPVAAGAFGSLTPARVVDTRNGSGPIAGKHSLTVAVAGQAGVPRTGISAVVLNVSATQGSRSGHLTVYGAGDPPNVSNVNYAVGQTVADLVIAPVAAGKVTIYNGGSGSVHVFVDVAGYVLATDHSPPPTSVSHYVRTVEGHFADSTDAGLGCADATAGSPFVLLDIGAQLNDKTGVALTVVDTKVTYAGLVGAVNGYLTSFAGCADGRAATVALGTNNGGDFSAYAAAARGKDWADKVVDAVAVPSGVTVMGANDIEGAFSSTEQQAEDWENAFVANTTKTLVFNGSADGCPTTYGAPNRTCAFGWTEADYVTLAGGHSARIVALPQMYTPAQAVQWGNIAASAGGTGLDFAGALTENAACPTSASSGCNGLAALPPDEGWSALFHSLSTVRTAPVVPAVTDLDIVS